MLGHGLTLKLHAVASAPGSLSSDVDSRLPGVESFQGPQALQSVSSCSSSAFFNNSTRGSTRSIQKNFKNSTKGSTISIQKNFLSRVETLPGHLACPAGSCDQIAAFGPRAILASDPATDDKVAREFRLEEGLQLRVKVLGASPASPTQVEFQVTNCHFNSLVLYWGLTKDGKRDWFYPSQGIQKYKQGGMQTSFAKVDDVASLTIELWDAKFDAIEFILKDESTNRWFKLNGGNFHVMLPQIQVPISQTQVSIPEELVQVQAYIRWERKGKQLYSPEKEKWEFEEARKELQNEILNGVSIGELYKRLMPHGQQSHKGSAGVARRESKSMLGIQRKKIDFSELINHYPKTNSKPADVTFCSRVFTPLELGAQAIEGADNGSVLQKLSFKLGGNDLMVLVTNSGGNLHVVLASNMSEQLILHWAVSKSSAGEWQIPPDNILPAGSSVLQGSCETPFKEGFAGQSSLQSLEICISDSGFLGIPFVLRSGEQWLNNSGSNFYIPLRQTNVKIVKDLGDGEGTAKWLLDEIANRESDAERSLMHRYNIAVDLTNQAKDEGELALIGILVWMRFMANRQLTWNKNYNVKPREISAAQDRLTDLLQAIFRDQPQHREITRLIMSTVGRGGQGDVGQRIRDEILVLQRKNDCKGGMMEEWHQKLHNNTSPDDVVICQALLDYIENDFKIEYYWKTLNSNGITKKRLASYDRPIVSEPRFRPDLKDGLLHDLRAYLRTLKAVHSGADLESAIAICMGYSAEGEGFMGGVQIHPISGLSVELPKLLRFVVGHVEDKEIIPLLGGLLESRREVRPTLLKHHTRLRDIIFLDLALDSTVRTAIERGLESLTNAQPLDISLVISMVLENLCLSADNNEELVYCLKDWHSILEANKFGGEQWALRAKAVLDRTRLALADRAEHFHEVLQPSAVYLGGLLGVEQWAVDIFTEEMIRAGSAVALSQLLNRLDPILRSIAHLGSWQVISPVEVHGRVVVVGELGEVQDKIYDRPTILVANRVKGEEEIPDGAVAVLTPDMPDVLSHVSVRARNSKVCFATCFDLDILSDLKAKEGRSLRLQPTAADLVYSEIGNTELSEDGMAAPLIDGPPPAIALKKKYFIGKFAVAADEFNSDLVGAKSRNIGFLKEKLPSWIKVPTSVALPFGVFEKVLSEKENKDVAAKVSSLDRLLRQGDLSKLYEIRQIVLELQAPSQLVEELKNKIKISNIPWPEDDGQERWEQAWLAIKKVWASKWNERAYLSTRKASIDHSDLCMAVLVQEIVRADYAFVIHTTNPANGDTSEIYAEVVKGLGETLVGAYSGRALSFVAKKSDLKSIKILGYPSKRFGLFINQSIIFRSDSNGEDLEGYAGAGLYDSVAMDKEEEKVVDYSSDPLVVDCNFQKSILSKIAEAGAAVEELYGFAQDIEGAIKDGELYIVQTRPQM
eukprot:c28967_g1_i1 orf=621-4901(-)